MSKLEALPTETIEHIAEDIGDRKTLIAFAGVSSRIRHIGRRVTFHEYSLTCVPGEDFPFAQSLAFLKDDPTIINGVRTLAICGVIHTTRHRLRDRPVVDIGFLSHILPLMPRICSLTLFNVCWSTDTTDTTEDGHFRDVYPQAGRSIRKITLDRVGGRSGPGGPLSLSMATQVQSLHIRYCDWEEDTGNSVVALSLPPRLSVLGGPNSMFPLQDVIPSTQTALTIHHMIGSCNYCRWVKAMVTQLGNALQELAIWIDNDRSTFGQLYNTLTTY